MAARSGKITEEIINAEYQAVYHYILSLCRDEKEAEDITGRSISCSKRVPSN